MRTQGIYALLYGAGDAKIGSIIGKGSSAGRKIKQRYFKNLPKLEKLMKQVDIAVQRGYLIGLDGRKLWIRSEHKGLNTLIQGAGALIMKTSMIFLDLTHKHYQYDGHKVLDMHDEAQWEVAPNDVELHSYLAEQSIIQAGNFYNLRCPMAADVKVGDNWSETH